MKKFIDLLKSFVQIKSVSADLSYKNEIERASKWLLSFMKESGMITKVVRGYDNPIVLAKTKKIPNLKTILIYGHYDVQPAEKSDGWVSSPFSLTLRNRRLYGRGSADNKGQILMHLYTVSKLIRENRLAYNIVFLIEGNEETGSPNLKQFIIDYKNELKCDYVLISDGELSHGNTPALEGSFRGVANFEVKLRTAKDDMHSGLFGGVVPNSALELSKILSSLHDMDQKIIVPNFYFGSAKQSKGVVGRKDFTKKLGTKLVFAKNTKEYEIKTGLRPTIEITSLYSGYLGGGFRNSIPAEASAKINIRSAPDQDPKVLFSLLEKYLLQIAPKHVDLQIILDSVSSGARLETENVLATESRKMMRDICGQEPIIKHSGGTLPIVNDFKEVLGVPQVMIPLANEDCGMHSATENISIESIKNGLALSEKLLSKSD